VVVGGSEGEDKGNGPEDEHDVKGVLQLKRTKKGGETNNLKGG